jgi:beta-alanine degradation protein BauB
MEAGNSSMPTRRKDVVGSAKAITTVDDERLRVTTWTFKDGEDTGYHRHEFDYVVVPVTGGTFEVVDRDGAIRAMTQAAATAYVGVVGTEHNVINRSGRTSTFVEIELKR